MRPRCIRDAYAFRRILGDMTGLCNLRCRFCSSDFRQASRAVMPLPLARGLPRLFDLVPEASFFLSFFYEPTLHPHFGEILAGLPPLARQKAVFSTNMACEMDDAAIAALAAAPVRRIIISLHTLQPELYAGLCGGRHVERLLSNLLRLGEACRAREARGEHAPPLQFHSLVLRDNYEEIPSLVQLAAERFHAAAHEVRTPVYGEHPGLPYTVRQLLTRAELESLLPRLSAAHGAVSCDFSLWRELFEQRQAAHEPLPNMRSRNSPGPVAVGKVLPQRYWDVRLDADGSAFFYGLGETCDLRELNRGDGMGQALREAFEGRLERLAAALPQRFACDQQQAGLVMAAQRVLSPPSSGTARLRQFRLGTQACRVRGVLDLPHGLEPADVLVMQWGGMMARMQRHALAPGRDAGASRWALESVLPPQDASLLPDEGHLLVLRGDSVLCRLPFLPDDGREGAP